MSAIKERIAAINAEIARIRPNAGVRLMAVSKNRTRAEIEEARAAGVRLFGENRVQEAREKWQEKFAIELHLIGHLQTNKIKYAVTVFNAIDSVDSERVADGIDRLAAPGVMSVMAEINPGREAAKTGMMPEALKPFLANAGRFSHLKFDGILAVLPQPRDSSREESQRIRRLMQETAEIWRMCRSEGWPWAPLSELSMGMTHDYAWALEAGATMIRIGEGIFGPRAQQG